MYSLEELIVMRDSKSVGGTYLRALERAIIEKEKISRK